LLGRERVSPESTCVQTFRLPIVALQAIAGQHGVVFRRSMPSTRAAASPPDSRGSRNRQLRRSSSHIKGIAAADTTAFVERLPGRCRWCHRPNTPPRMAPDRCSANFVALAREVSAFFLRKRASHPRHNRGGSALSARSAIAPLRWWGAVARRVQRRLRHGGGLLPPERERAWRLFDQVQMDFRDLQRRCEQELRDARQAMRTAILNLRAKGHGSVRSPGLSRSPGARAVLKTGTPTVPRMGRVEEADPYRDQILDWVSDAGPDGVPGRRPRLLRAPLAGSGCPPPPCGTSSNWATASRSNPRLDRGDFRSSYRDIPLLVVSRA
jgi:hypothetical protein